MTTFSNTLSSCSEPFLDEIYSPFLFAIILLSSVSKTDCKNVHFACYTDHISPPFHISSQSGLFWGGNGSSCSFLTFHIIHLVKSLLPSLLLFTELCTFCCMRDKHLTNHTVCNFHSVLSFSIPWLFQALMSSVLPFLLKMYFLQKAFLLYKWRDWVLPFCLTCCED